MGIAKSAEPAWCSSTGSEREVAAGTFASRVAREGSETLDIVVVGMGYVGIPCAALLADVPGFRVTGVQRRSERLDGRSNA
jgi:hypothetical protein